MSRSFRLSLPFKTGAPVGTAIVLFCMCTATEVADAPGAGAISDPYLGVASQATATRVVNSSARPRYHAAVSITEVEHAVVRYSRQYRIPSALLLAVIKAESDFNPIVISKAGAVGLMQLIPETAIRHGVRNLYDTDDNIAGGARHLRYLLDRFNGNLRLALAAYNAGERKVERYRRIPPYKETRAYVKKVMQYYRQYRAANPITYTNVQAVMLHQEHSRR